MDTQTQKRPSPACLRICLNPKSDASAMERCGAWWEERVGLRVGSSLETCREP